MVEHNNCRAKKRFQLPPTFMKFLSTFQFALTLLVIFLFLVANLPTICSARAMENTEHDLGIEDPAKNETSPVPNLNVECPDKTVVEQIAISSPLRGDGRYIPSNTPIYLEVPVAYLDVNSRGKNNVSFLVFSAAFDSLEPACTNKHKKVLDKLTISLSRASKPANIILQRIEEVKNPDRWQLLEDESLPEFNHYFQYRAARFKAHMLIPKSAFLGIPFVIRCLKPQDGKSPKIVGWCELQMGYRDIFLVKAKFDHSHLKDIHQVYRKVNSILGVLVKKGGTQ